MRIIRPMTSLTKSNRNKIHSILIMRIHPHLSEIATEVNNQTYLNYCTHHHNPMFNKSFEKKISIKSLYYKKKYITVENIILKQY